MPSSNIPYFFENFDKIPGWYGRESAALCEFFIDIIELHPHIFSGSLLEIGVYEGKSATHFAMHVREREKFYLNDVYDKLGEVAKRVAQASGCKGTVVPLTKFSSMIDRTDVPDRSIRFMHIDGDHGRRALHIDLAIADRVVREEGIVVLDDFFSPEFAGVTYGAFEWMTRNAGAFEMILVGFNKAYLCRPSFIPYFMRHINDELPRFLREAGVPDFTLARAARPSDCITVGVYNRRFDRDVITSETNFDVPDGPEGRRLEY